MMVKAGLEPARPPGQRKRWALLIVQTVILVSVLAGYCLACCVTNADLWAGTTPGDTQHETITICKGDIAYFEAECVVNPGEGDIRYDYDFDDGDSNTHQHGGTTDTAAHRYTSAGTYTVTVEVERVGTTGCSKTGDCTVIVCPCTPTLEAPEDTATCQDPNGIDLVWEADLCADGYNVYLRKNLPPTDSNLLATPDSNSCSTGTLEAGTKYYWTVKACDGNDCSDASSPRRFWTIPGKAGNPDPEPNTAGVYPEVSLSWAPGAGVADVNGHDVYFGTDSNDVNDANTSSTVYWGPQDSNTWTDPNGLAFGQVYFWRIDEVNQCAPPTKGDVWQFTTCILPDEANAPYPEPNATGVLADVVLSWTPGTGTADVNGHDVYFGTDFNDVNDANTSSAVYEGRQDPNTWDSNNYDPNGLVPGQTYYWRIDETNECTQKGNVWCFTTCFVPGEANGPQAQGPGGEPNAIDSILSWTPGSFAEEHVVFFGVDFNDVNSTITSSAQYMGIVDVNSFDTRRRSGFLFSDGRQKSIGSLKRVPDPNVIYVDRAAKGADNGTSWADAYNDLQDALTDAGTSGKDIWVAEGIYKPTDGNDRTASFDLISGVDVYGGFAGGGVSLEQRNWRKYRTVLSGDINEPGDMNDNSYRVVKGADNAIIDGFTISGGSGGGIYCNAVSPTINNCTIEGNKASGVGAGIYTSGSPQLTTCLFRNNESLANGGAMANYPPGAPMLTNCVFYATSAVHQFSLIAPSPKMRQVSQAEE
jgi:parallel beta-helix repeat protein